MTETPRDRLFREEIADPERLRLHMRRLLDLLNARLDPSKRYLVYVLAQASRIGHLVLEPWMLRTMFADRYEDIVLVISPRAEFANKAMHGLLERHFTLVETDDLVLTTIGFLDGGGFGIGNYDFFLASPQNLFRQFTKGLANGMPHRFLELPEEMVERARAFRRSAVGSAERPYVVMHVRDQAYGPDMAYHAFRFNPIASFRDAVGLLLERGYAVFRIGDRDSPPLDLDSPNYVEIMRRPDYADWLDLGLAGEAAFGIFTQSGPWAVFQAFGRPILLTNAYPQKFWVFEPREMALYKHFFKDGREMSYRATWQAGIDAVATTAELDERGISVASNNAEEVRAGVEEMLSLIAADAVPDSAVQQRYYEITAAFDETVVGKAAQHALAPRRHRRLAESFVRLNPGFLA